MSKYEISACTVQDHEALANNNIKAWWSDQHWTIPWRHRTREHVIEQVIKRMPRTLLADRTFKRHQKAVDPETGRLLGCARWTLPLSHATNADGTPAWPEALVPAVSPEEEAEINRVAETAIWDPNEESDVLFAPINKIEKELMGDKPYMLLVLLAVNPEDQGKGVATALVESGIRAAEKLGLDIFILAFKAGLGVYKRLGFRVLQEYIQDDSMYGGTGDHRVYYMTNEKNRVPTEA
ncbi:hypothetical protein PT974_08164 [Cladobotryum mycophilum]|uniref:N-acetyltransferase domain-containing protein n=1 Tax=Cladobotryum mycophilum TaxID=491253 RepID=A0ABR0SE04_9HYPO